MGWRIFGLIGVFGISVALAGGPSIAAPAKKETPAKKDVASKKEGAEKPDPSSLLSAAEAKDVDAVIASMIAAGFPDTQKATVYCGKISVLATFDPTKDPHPLPSSASDTQMTDSNSNNVTYGYTFGGLHFKLADGSWIISLSYRFKPKAGDKVNTADAEEIKVASITEDAIAANPFDASKDAAKWLDAVAPAQRERATRAMNKLVPVTKYLRLDGDALGPATILLSRAGWSDAKTLSLAIADQRARSYWQLRPWTNVDPIFDPSGAYPTLKDEEIAWQKKTATFTSEAPAIALRRALFRWCRAQLMVEEPEDALLPTKAAAAAAKAAVDPKDPQHNTARVDALVAATKLPVTPKEDADLPTRLQSWEVRPRMPRMTVTGGNGGGAGAAISTSFAAPVSAYEPDRKDLDALVALLDDPRPSRFSDFAGPHPVADNAWRALAALLKSDPRTLAGYPTDKPWTDKERKSAAAAVQAWWKKEGKSAAAAKKDDPEPEPEEK